MISSFWDSHATYLELSSVMGQIRVTSSRVLIFLLSWIAHVAPFSLSFDGSRQWRECSVLSMSSTEKQRSESRSKEFRSLKPLPCLGSYEQDMGVKYSSLFLGFEQMVVQERSDGKCVCKGARISLSTASVPTFQESFFRKLTLSFVVYVWKELYQYR